MVLIAEVERKTQFEQYPEYIETLKRDITRFMAEAIQKQGLISFSKRGTEQGKSLYKGKITLLTEEKRLNAVKVLGEIVISGVLDPVTKDKVKEILTNITL